MVQIKTEKVDSFDDDDDDDDDDNDDDDDTWRWIISK